MKILSATIAASILAAWAGTQIPDYLTQNLAVFRAANVRHRSDGVDANGRCGGISYGTGAQSCGTATGGEVGGLNSRN